MYHSQITRAFLFAFLLLHSGFLLSQWQQLHLPSLSSASSYYDGGSVVYASSPINHNELFHSTDKKHWLRTNSISSSTGYLVSGDTIISSSIANELFISVDRGNLWTQQNLPFNSSSIRVLRFHASRIFISTYQNTFYYSDNLGQTWTQFQSLPSIANGLYIQEIGGQLVLGTSASILKSADRGTTWEVTKAASVNEQIGLIFLVNQTLYVNISSSSPGGPNNKWYESVDQGASWFETTILPPDVITIFGDGNSIFYTMPDPISGAYTTYVSDDNGQSFINTGRHIDKISEGLLQDDNNLCSFDHGVTWELGMFDYNSTFVYPWAGQNHINREGNGSVFLRAKDNEIPIKWKIDSTNLPFVDATWKAGNLIIAWTQNGYFQSVDDGLSWSLMALDNFRYFIVDVLHNGTLLIMNLDNGLNYYSNDLGVSLIDLPQGFQDFNQIHATSSVAYFQSDANSFFTAPLNDLSNVQPFSLPQIPGFSQFDGFSFFSSDKYLYARRDFPGALFRFDGTEWKQCLYQGSTVFPNMFSYNIAQAFGNEEYITSETFTTLLYFSADEGLNWTEISDQFNIQNINSVYLFASNNQLYVQVEDINYYTTVFYKPIKSYSLSLAYGQTFKDLNENGQIDQGEPPLKHLLLRSEPLGYYAVSDTVGQFELSYQSGTPGTIKPILQHPYQLITTQILAIDTLPGAQHFIGISEVPNVQDLSVDISFTPIFRPGFETYLYITARNVGTKASSGIITFIHEPIVEFISSTPVLPNPTNGDTLFYQVPVLQPGETFKIYLTVKTKNTATVGNFVNLTAQIDPIQSDQNQLNNIHTIRELVLGSYDPNDKAVRPEFLHPDIVSDGMELEYTIRFQNTGNFPADFVRILDTLDNHLDVASIKVVAASHAHTWTLRGRNVLDIFFENILLPDSTSNEPASHGFVKFAIKADSTLKIGDRINNTAQIYFDFNPAIVTNTVVSEVKIVKTKDPQAELLHFDITPNPGRDNFSIHLPKPITEPVSVRIIDATGRLVVEQKHLGLYSGTSLPPLMHAASGIYLIQLELESGLIGTRKLRIE